MEISIHDLAHMIAGLTDFTGMIEWDAGKPDGQPRRSLDTSKAKTLFGFEAKTKFQDGLKQTIDYFIRVHPCPKYEKSAIHRESPHPCQSMGHGNTDRHGSNQSFPFFRILPCPKISNLESRIMLAY